MLFSKLNVNKAYINIFQLSTTIIYSEESHWRTTNTSILACSSTIVTRENDYGSTKGMAGHCVTLLPDIYLVMGHTPDIILGLKTRKNQQPKEFLHVQKQQEDEKAKE